MELTTCLRPHSVPCVGTGGEPRYLALHLEPFCLNFTTFQRSRVALRKDRIKGCKLVRFLLSKMAARVTIPKSCCLSLTFTHNGPFYLLSGYRRSIPSPLGCVCPNALRLVSVHRYSRGLRTMSFQSPQPPLGYRWLIFPLRMDCPYSTNIDLLFTGTFRTRPLLGRPVSPHRRRTS